MITVLTGLTEEQALFQPSENLLVLTGALQRDNLANLVPQNCTGLVSFGVCGALSPKLNLGVPVLPRQVITLGEVYSTDINWVNNLEYDYHEPAFAGSIYSIPTIATTTPQGRAALFNKYGALSVDMESAAVAAIATARKLPFIVVRAVSDTADETLPSDTNTETNPDGSPNVPNVLEGLLNHPNEFIQVMREAEGFHRALKTLCGFVPLIK